MVNNGHLFLEARDAPLGKIFEEIGKQAKITIDSNIGPGEKITIRLDRVPLEEGLKRLAKNVTVFYTQGPNDRTHRIERVVVLSEGKGVSGQVKASSQPEKVKEPAPQEAKVTKPPPEPFKFQFDPAKSARKEKAENQPR